MISVCVLCMVYNTFYSVGKAFLVMFCSQFIKTEGKKLRRYFIRKHWSFLLVPLTNGYNGFIL